eukprot:3283336-Alexandrium_andersonii.AAC.1
MRRLALATAAFAAFEVQGRALQCLVDTLMGAPCASCLSTFTRSETRPEAARSTLALVQAVLDKVHTSSTAPFILMGDMNA